MFLLLYRHRESASLLATLLTMVMLVLVMSLKPTPKAPVPLESAVEIRMLQEAPPEPPQQSMPQVPRPARALPTLSAAQPQPRPILAPVKPASATPTGDLPAQVAPPGPKADVTAHAEPVLAAPAAVIHKSAEPARPAANSNDAYVARVRAYVLGRKKYPTGREASIAKPTGVVRAWVVLDRQGEVQEAGVERSADSLILDSEALKLLRSGSYPAFPDDAFAGQASHRFYFDLDYKRGGDS